MTLTLTPLHILHTRAKAQALLQATASDRYLTHQIARKLGHDPEVVLTPSRVPNAVQARAEVAQVLRELGWSYPRVGRAIGRDHAAVMYLLGTSKRGRERLARRETA